MRYLVKRIPSTSLVQYDGSRYYCEIAGGTAEKATVDTTGLLAGSKYLDVQTGTWYVYDELTNAWAVSAEGGSADPAVVEAAVEAWLDAHPEATTTVQDGSISYAKLDTTLKGKADAVSSLSDEIADIQFVKTFTNDWGTKEDGTYYYAKCSMRAGKTYVITRPTANGITVYLRAEKNVTPSLVTLGLTGATWYYHAEVDTNWMVCSSDNPKEMTITDYDTLSENTIRISDYVRNAGFYKSNNIITTFKNGNWGINSNGVTESTTRCYAPLAYLKGTAIHLEIPSTMKGRMNFLTDTNQCIDTITTRTWTAGAFDFDIPEGAVSIGISVAYVNDATITPADCTDVVAYWYYGEIPDDEQNAFSGKRISILGDSISTFAGANAESAGDGHQSADGTYTYAGNHCRYPTSYLSNVDDTYWKKLIDSLGMVLGVNDSWAGSKVSWTGGESSDAGADIYIASPTRIGHLDDNGTPDIILVNAGTNDIYNSTLGTFNTENPVSYTDQQIAELPVNTFADAYRAMLIRLQKAYPLAKIVVMLPNYTTTYYNPTKADSYLEVIKEACDFFGVPWVDMRTTGITMYNTGTYLGDGIHPNVAGMNLLYKKLEKFFVYSL